MSDYQKKISKMERPPPVSSVLSKADAALASASYMIHGKSEEPKPAEVPTTSPPVTASQPSEPATKPTAINTKSVASVSSQSGKSSVTPRTRALDLKHNDNSFIVIASLVVDRFAKRLESQSFLVTEDDRATLDRMVSTTVRKSFVDAVNFRLQDCPEHSQKQLHVVLRKCRSLGLNRKGTQNVLFTEANTVFTVINQGGEGDIPGVAKVLSVEEENEVLRAQLEMQKLQIAQQQDFMSAHLPPQQVAAGRQEDESAVSGPDDPSLAAVNDDPESLARKQLMAELREASNLMAESVTPEAAKFWRNHVVELQARLRALHGEGGGSVQLANTASHPLEHVLSQEKPQTAIKSMKSTQEETEQVMKSNEAQMSDLKQNLTKQNINSGYVPPNRHVISANSPQYDGKSPPPPSQVDMDPKLKGVPMVDVVSPADLPSGYMFEAQIDQRRFIAIVPPGGARRGETFTCHMRDLETVGSDIPVGRWRDSLSDCCHHGICHPLLLNALCCPLLALGQIMSRMGFDFLGRPTAQGKNYNTSWSMMVTISCFWVIVNFAIFAGYNYKWARGMELSTADWAALAVFNIFMLVFTIFVTATTRGSIRDKYLIRENRFYDLEDCFCATLCMPCTICQMGRHTAVYHRHEAACCTSTGLEEGEGLLQTQCNTNAHIV